MVIEYSKKAYVNSDKLAALHEKMASHIEKVHGETLGQLTAAHEQHRAVVKGSGKGTKAHHYTAAVKASDVCKLAKKVRLSSIALAKLAAEMESVAYSTATSHSVAQNQAQK